MRRGNCLLLVCLLLALLIGGSYFLLRTPAKTEEELPTKPVIKSFGNDISGTWRAKFVKINIPRGRKADYRPSWFKDNPRDFEAEVEIGRDYYVKRLKWVEVATGYSESKAEWLAFDRWKFSMIEQKARAEEERGQSERDGNKLSLHYQGALGQVRECRFSLDDLPEVPQKYRLDGGFREGSQPGEIEAEILLYAPELKNRPFKPGKLQIQISPFDFQFKKSRLTVNDERIRKLIDDTLGEVIVKFDDLKRLGIASVKDIDLHQYYVKGYPGGLCVGFTGVNAGFRYGPQRQDDSVYIEQVPGSSQAILEMANDSKKRVIITFSADGSGKMLTHNGEMEFKLIR